MYILEGLRDFMISKRWEAGDTGIYPNFSELV